MFEDRKIKEREGGGSYEKDSQVGRRCLFQSVELPRNRHQVIVNHRQQY
jgi:hypothetical protein